MLVLVLVLELLLVVLIMSERRSSEWPPGIMGRVALALPQATAAELNLAKSGFESYLAAVRHWGPSASVAMPSRSVDEVWHNAMLHSRFYERLCQESVGWFVHHEPGPIAGTEQRGDGSRVDPKELQELARAWIGSCLHEGIDPMGSDLPTLFAADRLLGVDGFHYAADKRVSIVSIQKIQEASKELVDVGPPSGLGWLRRRMGRR